jgi:hypothetical protein
MAAQLVDLMADRLVDQLVALMADRLVDQMAD